MSEPTKTTFTTYSDDPEVRAIETLATVLGEFDARTRTRILRYATERWGNDDPLLDGLTNGADS